MFKTAVRATHLNTVYLSRLKNSQLVETSNIDEILIKINRNVVRKQFNSIAKTVNCK